MKHLGLLAIALFHFAAWSADTTFYFAAHEDDWQLFMNPEAYDDVQSPATKVVFIHLTAGDAGTGLNSWGGSTHAYYLARENGARMAVQFMADAGQTPVEPIETYESFNGKSLLRIVYRNTVTYFLRLPDGGDGAGYPSTGNQSLANLRSATVQPIVATDGSSSYENWADLTATLRSMIDFERSGSPTVTVNVAELDESINPGDHSDHLNTAQAAVDAIKDLTCVTQRFFVDYASAQMPANLTDQGNQEETSTYAVTASGLTAFGYEGNWEPGHLGWLGRSYSRTIAGAGVCE
jgi:hypothetical protein